MTAQLVLAVEESKKNAFLEMLKLFDFVKVLAVSDSDIDNLDEFSAEFVADLQTAAMDNNMNDTISNDEAFKLFRKWAQE